VGESDKEQTIETCIHEIAETLAVLESASENRRICTIAQIEDAMEGAALSRGAYLANGGIE
jgi:hypothetical protein